MICASHICLAVLLCLMTVRNAVAIKKDTVCENAKDNTLRKIAEIWKSSCTPCFLNTNRSNEKVKRRDFCDRIWCLSGMGPVSESRICISWNLSVVVNGRECNIFSRANCHLDKEIKNILINTTTSSSTGVSGPVDNENSDFATAAADDVDVDKDEDDDKDCNDYKDGDDDKGDDDDKVDDDNKDGDDDKDGNDDKNDDDGNEIEDHPCNDNTNNSKQCKRFRKRHKSQKRDKKTIHQKNVLHVTSPGSTKSPIKPGIFVLTHLIAVGIGAGLLYCVLFIKKVKRKLNGKIREERNKETNSAYISHNLQKGSTGSTSSPYLIPDEDVYCEVADKVQHDSSQFANFAYSVADNSVLEGRQNTKRPDIPQQTIKDDNQYLTPMSRSLPHEYLDSSGMAIKEKSEKEIWLEDGTIQKSEMLSNIYSSKDSLETETIGNYFVLKKSTDMDLK